MIVVDTSALIAILFNELGSRALVERLSSEGDRYLSAVSYVEAGTVIAGRLRDAPTQAISILDGLVTELGATVRPVDEAQMRVAMRARIEFGRGFGAPAGLNFGDCFAYALAKTLDAPLLFVGNDFARTDLKAAM